MKAKFLTTNFKLQDYSCGSQTPDQYINRIEFDVIDENGELIYFTEEELIEKGLDDSFWDPEHLLNIGFDKQVQFFKTDEGYVYLDALKEKHKMALIYNVSTSEFMRISDGLSIEFVIPEESNLIDELNAARGKTIERDGFKIVFTDKFVDGMISAYKMR